MSSVDFNHEKEDFIKYYNNNIGGLERAKNNFISIIQSIVSNKDIEQQVIGRIKNRDESIKKFGEKYQRQLESKNKPYEIKDYITDLIGLRVICLYEKDINHIKDVLEKEFKVIDITDKSLEIESTNNSFGYKGLHMNLKLTKPRSDMVEHKNHKDQIFEVQIRTIIQDAWSNLDHKIKYKKSIPNELKRRINIIAALFELADSEFEKIQERTIKLEETIITNIQEQPTSSQLDAFTFLEITQKQFENYKFIPYKVDEFVEDINSYEEKGKKITSEFFTTIFNDHKNTLDKYESFLENKNCSEFVLNPYTYIRHILYLNNKEKYGSLLYKNQIEQFDTWIKKQDNQLT